MRDLPIGWNKPKLSDVFWFQEGPGVRNWQFKQSGIKLLNVANITTEGVLDLSKTDRHLDPAEVKEKYQHFLVDVDDLVIASSGISFDDDGFLRTRGVFIEEKHLPLCMNTSTIRFKAIEGVSDLNYFKYWLQSYEFRNQVSKFVTGTAQLNFGPSHLKKMHISLPPLGEQQRIAAVLDKADELRAKRRTAVAKLDTLLQSTFLHLFGDPVTNPMGWEIRPLIQLVDENRPITYGILKPGSDLADGIPYVRVVDMADGKVLTHQLRKTSLEISEQYKRSKLIQEDLLLSIRGHVGRLALVPPEITGANITQDTARLAINHQCNVHFVMSVLETIHMQRFMQYFVKGMAVQGINLGDVKKLPIIVPPLEIQEKFANIASRFLIIKQNHKTHLNQLDDLFHALQQRAFNGQL